VRVRAPFPTTLAAPGDPDMTAALQARISHSLVPVAFALLLGACGPSYPNCGSDDHCKEKGEFCVDKKCAQCRETSHCPNPSNDPCVACIMGSGGQRGACGRKADCCANNLDCGSGRKCQGNRCVAECAADTECPAGQKCLGGSCSGGATEAGGGCKKDGDCGPGLACKDGKCLDAKGSCRVVPAYFDFNEYALTSAAQDTISSSWKCMKEKGASQVVVEGHCDERGTDAYNMELGNRRAKATKTYLQQIAPKLKVKTLSYGKTRPACSGESEGESCWAQNRRTEFKSDKE
jgi:peptidoglycan-associated lipoprotein